MKFKTKHSLNHFCYTNEKTNFSEKNHKETCKRGELTIKHFPKLICFTVVRQSDIFVDNSTLMNNLHYGFKL